MHREMTLAEVAREVHENAKAHGWWDEEREAAEIYALIHSEWSEALEEYRAGRPDRWYPCEHLHYMCEENNGCKRNNPNSTCIHRGAKPEGICVELIDGVIRILDYLGKTRGTEEYTDGTIDHYMHALNDEGEEVIKEWQALSVPTLINLLHNEVCKVDIAYAKVFGVETECFLGLASIAWQWIKGRGLDPMELLMEKHEYNKTRPYKHGKVC